MKTNKNTAFHFLSTTYDLVLLCDAQKSSKDFHQQNLLATNTIGSKSSNSTFADHLIKPFL